MQETDLLHLFDTYANMIYRIALNYLRSHQDAEDTVQAVFLKLIEGKAKPMSGKERAYLTQITLNHCRDILRTVKRRQTVPLDEKIIFQESKDKELFYAVMELPQKYRIVIYLHYYEGYTFSEIAAFLKLGSSAVSMRLYRARAILKKTLGGDYNGL